MPDLIVFTAEIAFKQYEKGNITHKELVCILERCINATAQMNGYVEQYGLPFPETENE